MTKDITDVTYDDYIDKFRQHAVNTLAPRGYTIQPTAHKEYLLVTKVDESNPANPFYWIISAHPAGYKRWSIRATGDNEAVISYMIVKGLTRETINDRVDEITSD